MATSMALRFLKGATLLWLMSCQTGPTVWKLLFFVRLLWVILKFWILFSHNQFWLLLGFAPGMPRWHALWWESGWPGDCCRFTTSAFWKPVLRRMCWLPLKNQSTTRGIPAQQPHLRRGHVKQQPPQVWAWFCGSRTDQCSHKPFYQNSLRGRPNTVKCWKWKKPWKSCGLQLHLPSLLLVVVALFVLWVAPTFLESICWIWTV